MTAMTPELTMFTLEQQEQLRIAMENVRNGVRDPQRMRAASLRMQAALAADKAKHGVKDIGVEIIRELRDR